MADEETDRATTWRATQIRSKANAYDQVADQIRLAVISGELKVGDRLRSENDLGHDFGVSRGTIREALRVLTSQGFVTTTRGVKGGSTISYPSTGQMQRFLGTSLALLAGQDVATIEWMLETRELIEIPAAGLAATRHHLADLEAMTAALHPAEFEDRRGRETAHVHHGFHLAMLRATGNTMLEMLLQPLFGVMQSKFDDAKLDAATLKQIEDEHARIAAAIGEFDSEGASLAMKDHLETLRAIYENVIIPRTDGDAARAGEEATPAVIDPVRP